MSTLLLALALSATMAWDILWALILGFTLSAVVQAIVSKEEMSHPLPDASPRTLARASALGAASSSCSYAAVALARAMFTKGADFTAAMAFQFASTNLVLELGILLWLLLAMASARLALHSRRVPRRSHHDRPACAALPPLPETPDGPVRQS